jgi:hypothetical protein
MTKEIVIDGVNLTELKTKYDALAAEQSVLWNSIRKGASKFMANSVEEVLKAVDDMASSATTEEAEKHAEKAYELLSEVQFVSEISGIPFDIGYMNIIGKIQFSRSCTGLLMVWSNLNVIGIRRPVNL